MPLKWTPYGYIKVNKNEQPIQNVKPLNDIEIDFKGIEDLHKLSSASTISAKTNNSLSS